MNSNEKSFLSIIVPIYNKENYLPLILDTLNEQESKDFEVIFINDGSTDNSLNVLNQSRKNFKFKHKIIDKKNEGVSITRNLGIDLSEGEYVYFLDADDNAKKELVKEIEKKTETKTLDMIWFGYDRYQRNLENEIKLIRVFEQKYKYYREVSPDFLLKKYIEQKFGIHMCSLVFRKKYLVQNNIYFEPNIGYGEDQAFVIEALSKNPEIDSIEKSLFHYIETPNSAVNTPTVKKLQTIEIFIKVLNADWFKEKKAMKEKIGKDFYRMILSYYLKYKGKKIDNYILEMKRILNNYPKDILIKHKLIISLLIKIGEKIGK